MSAVIYFNVLYMYGLTYFYFYSLVILMTYLINFYLLFVKYINRIHLPCSLQNSNSLHCGERKQNHPLITKFEDVAHHVKSRWMRASRRLYCFRVWIITESRDCVVHRYTYLLFRCRTAHRRRIEGRQ